MQDRHKPTRVRHFVSAVLILWSVVSVTAASAQEAVFYGDIHFSGGSFSASSDQAFVGWDWNDAVSSVYVPAGMTVTLYEHADFNGAALTLSAGDIADLRDYQGPGADGTWNDQASSLRVSGGPPPAPTVHVVMVNGTGNVGSIPSWMQSGAPEVQAIAATYGVQPTPFHWQESSFLGVLYPYYNGITSGSFGLANYVAGLPAGDVNIVAHSHGGNVAILASWWAARPIRRMINLGTPVNWNLERYAEGVIGRCQISSWADWVQFIGASPTQVYEFSYASYQAYQYAMDATQAYLAGDYSLGAYYSGLATAYLVGGYYYFESTKVEWQGPTHMFGGQSHGDLHEPPVWQDVARHCS